MKLDFEVNRFTRVEFLKERLDDFIDTFNYDRKDEVPMNVLYRMGGLIIVNLNKGISGDRSFEEYNSKRINKTYRTRTLNRV